MSTIFDKLNLKDQREILVVHSPASFESELAALHDIHVLREPKTAKTVDFSLAFVTRQSEVDSLARLLAQKARDDALLWFAYPKGSSKKYTCELNRDTGWDALKMAGFDTVRQVAIDEDWSALRFRRVEYIGSTSKKAKA